MSLRDTQHYVEVLCTDVSVLRATQQYVEILARGPIGVSASDVISLTSTAITTGTIRKDLTDSLSVLDAAVGINNFPASDTLLLSQSVGVVLKVGDNKAATHNLVLSQSVGLLKSSVKPVQHNLVLTDHAHNFVPISVSMEDTLSLTDEAFAGSLFYSASNTLSIEDEAILQRLPLFDFTDTLDLTDEARITVRDLYATNDLDLSDVATTTGPRYVVAVDNLQLTEPVFDPITLTFTTGLTGGLQDSVIVSANVALHTSNIISFADQAVGYVLRTDATALDATDTLTLTDKAQLSTTLDAISTLELTDTASAQSGVPVTQVMELSDAATVNISRAGVELTDTIEITHAVRFVLERDCLRFKFAPMIGSTTDPNAPTPPPAAMPDFSGTNGFRLQYPSSGPVTDEVIVNKGPEFGNIDRFQMDRINRESRGGTLLVYADPIWPKITTLVLKFSALSQSVGRELLRFVQEHIGQEISLIDWEGRAWVGVVTNPQDPLVQDDRNSYTASFEFQGERV